MRALTAIALAILLSLPAFADEVVLKSGGRFSGEIESVTDEEVVILTDIGRMRFARALVEEIHRDDDEAEGPSGTAAEVRVTIPDVRADVAPAVAGARVVLARREGGVTAFAADTGEEAWSSNEGGTGICGVAADPGGVYVATTEGTVFRLNPTNGERLWIAGTGRSIEGAPLLFRRGVFVFGPGAGLFGIESATGLLRGLLEIATTLDTPLAVAGSHVAAGDRDGRLLVMNADGTELTAVAETNTPWGGRPLATSLGGVALGGGQTLTVFDTDAGRVAREFPVPGLAGQPLAADAGRAYVLEGGVLAARDLVTGRSVWRNETVGGIARLGEMAGALLATTADGKLLALSIGDGRTRWSLDLPAPASGEPVVAGELVWVVTTDGECVVCAPGTGAAPAKAGSPSATTPEAAPATAPEPEPTPVAAGRTIHSPDGYRVDIPKGWEFSENLTRGSVSLGLRMEERAAGGAAAAEASLLRSMTIAVGPAGEDDPLDRLVEESKNLGFAAERLPGESGGWRQVRLTRAAEDLLPSRDRRAAVRTEGDRVFRVELTAPAERERNAEEAWRTVLGTFAVEKPDDWEPAPPVAAAREFLAAFAAGDRTKVIGMLDPGMRYLVPNPIRSRGELSLPTGVAKRGPDPRIARVRVRREGRGGTDFEWLALVERDGAWIVQSPGPLLR